MAQRYLRPGSALPASHFFNPEIETPIFSAKASSDVPAGMVSLSLTGKLESPLSGTVGSAFRFEPRFRMPLTIQSHTTLFDAIIRVPGGWKRGKATFVLTLERGGH